MFSGRILKVFLWKHFKRLFKHWIANLIIICIPLGLMSFILYVNVGFNRNFYEASDDVQSYPQILRNDKYLEDILQDTLNERNIFFTPNVDDPKYTMLVLRDIIDNMTQKSRYFIDHRSNRYVLDIVGYRNPEEMYNLTKKLSTESSLYMIFEKDNQTKKMEYTIRLAANRYSDRHKIFTEHEIYHTPDNELSIVLHNDVGIGRYYDSGFLAAQMAFEMSYLKFKTELAMKEPPILTLDRAPLIIDKYSSTLIPLFTFFVMISVTIICASMVMLEIVEEKQVGIKEIFETVTTFNYLNHVALFIIGLIFNLLIFVYLFVQMIYYDAYSCTPLVYPIVLTLLFILCMLSFSFFISTIFDSISYASFVGVLCYLIPYIVLDFDTTIGTFFRFLSPLLLFDEGMILFNNFLRYQQCFTGVDVFYDEHPIVHYTIFQIYTALILTSVLYLFLYYYFSNVFPGQLGTAKPFYFLFTQEYWCPNRRLMDDMLSPLTESQPSGMGSSNNPLYVQVNNLYKTFQNIPYCGKKFTAVHNVSFHLQENRITVLLGHNGAGKTTIMNMITGLVQPTAGNVTVDDQTNVSIYRTTIGYCPQHNIFLSYLTTREHLILFGRLRGLSDEETNKETEIWLEKVKLKDHANTEAKKLSHETKRQLSLACALIGHTKLVILDEPSTGLDPEARRDLWNILLTLRKERTILLTTHSMEDADVLGDKIIILDHGTVVCEGTQFSLKKQFGSGYTLKVMIGPTFNLTRTMETINSIIPKAEIKSEVYPTIRITLPFDAIKDYSRILKELEDRQEELGIESISMSNTTMDEVFLKSPSIKQNRFDETTNGNGSNYVQMDTTQQPTGKYLLGFEFLAIFYKKYIFLKKCWIRFAVHVSLPLLAILAAFFIMEFSQDLSKRLQTENKFDLTAKHIENQQIMLIINETVPNYDQIVTNFKNLAGERQIEAVIRINMSSGNALYSYELGNRRSYMLKFLGALEVFMNKTSVQVRSFYQPRIVYSSSYCLNFATNLLLRSLVSGNETLSVVNWPVTIDDLKSYRPTLSNFRFSLITIFPMTFFWYITFYLFLPHKEESTGFRTIQKISPIRFWIATYLTDVVLHTFACGLIILFTWIMDTRSEMSGYMGSFFFIILLCGYAEIAMLYFLAKVIKRLTSVYSYMFLLFFLGIIGFMIFFHEDNIRGFFPWLFFFIFHLIPEFNIRNELHILVFYQPGTYDHSMSTFIVASLIQIVCFILATVYILENAYSADKCCQCFEKINPCRCLRKPKLSMPGELIPRPENQNVTAEAEKVRTILHTGDISNYSLIVSKLEKSYSRQTVVKGVDFAVRKGECFGLLGMNGAGKSTIFKMMSLKLAVSRGDIFVNGHHNRRQVDEYSKEFGYCPETSGVLGFMSSYEILKYMALMKGTTSASNLEREVSMWLAKMDLVDFKNLNIEGYSGGTKRKLSTALAMISDPSVLFLDEPTSGVDPVSRRFIWRCIKEFQANNKTVVLSSHSMDECEEVCNRLGIMVAGKFQCIGYVQQLKESYGTGFTLMVKLKEDLNEYILTTIKEGVMKLFQAKLKDEYAELMIFSVFENNIKWSMIFEKIQQFCDKNARFIDDFAVTEISLEDVFLQFRQNERNRNSGVGSSLV